MFEILWFDVRNYNDQLPDEILVPIKFSTCGKSSQFPTKKKKKKRIYFGHAEWILIIFFGRFDTVWEHSLFRMWQKQRTYRSWWYESPCSWASMHSDNGVVGVWKNGKSWWVYTIYTYFTFFMNRIPEFFSLFRVVCVNFNIFCSKVVYSF